MDDLNLGTGLLLSCDWPMDNQSLAYKR